MPKKLLRDMGTAPYRLDFSMLSLSELNVDNWPSCLISEPSLNHFSNIKS